ncbi:MAG: type II toxin-antitoxin system RelE/ParE family toxin [Calditrichaeota bacterium]|nr:MAG: type II toxin-antitoxin system RelE/ParE family toxin [Calditrichota bacterium]MBL1205937.1 type II toxin-antitoxin system RelE/ParE family toxin [Calditrichota bacterium]NOG45765.1 type II toxin-antitoxin system RelE/ParE family toxin [Calditrichota bacterium]
MIKSFRDKETELIWNQKVSKKYALNLQKIALRKLFIIHAAKNLNDLKIPPANCLEKLKGSRKGQYSIRINNQWRICFIWKESDAYQVEIVDYH